MQSFLRVSFATSQTKTQVSQSITLFQANSSYRTSTADDDNPRDLIKLWSHTHTQKTTRGACKFVCAYVFVLAFGGKQLRNVIVRDVFVAVKQLCNQVWQLVGTRIYNQTAKKSSSNQVFGFILLYLTIMSTS